MIGGFRLPSRRLGPKRVAELAVWWTLIALSTLIPFFGDRVSAANDLFQIELWPGEGRPIIACSADVRVSLRGSPDSGLVGAEASCSRNQRLEFDEVVFRTLRSGSFVTRSSQEIEGRGFDGSDRISKEDYYRRGRSRIHFRLTAGDRIEYLQPRAEGTCFARIRGIVAELEPCPTSLSGAFTLVAPPQNELWIHTTVGRQRGWTLVDGISVRIVDREF